MAKSKKVLKAEAANKAKAQIPTQVMKALSETLALSQDYLKLDRDVNGIYAEGALTYLKKSLPKILHPAVALRDVQSVHFGVSSRFAALVEARDNRAEGRIDLCAAMSKQEPALLSLYVDDYLMEVFVQIATFDPYKTLPTMCAMMNAVQAACPEDEETEDDDEDEDEEDGIYASWSAVQLYAEMKKRGFSCAKGAVTTRELVAALEELDEIEAEADLGRKGYVSNMALFVERWRGAFATTPDYVEKLEEVEKVFKLNRHGLLTRLQKAGLECRNKPRRLYNDDLTKVVLHALRGATVEELVALYPGSLFPIKKEEKAAKAASEQDDKSVKTSTKAKKEDTAVARPTLLARLKARGLRAKRNTSDAIVVKVLELLDKGLSPRQICNEFVQMRPYKKDSSRS